MTRQADQFSRDGQIRVRWHIDVGDSGANLLQPALTENAIYAASAKGVLTRLDRATGKSVWRIETDIDISGGVGTGNGYVLVGGNKGDVLAYDEDGKLLWKSKVSSEVLSVSPVADGYRAGA